MRVIATAGHVDHGKSSLVRALTGTDPDRLEEEQRRGLTIDLGFAFTGDIAFVDVPGHVRFLKNMLAGVGAVSAAVLVVAATEGWKPQSEEHLRILELLGVEHGFTVVTKASLADAEALELVQLEVAERLAGTFLDGAPVLVCDSITGEGLDAVRAALEALPAAAGDDRGRPRLWVDRVFSAKGAGTVVTGTLTGGPLHVDDVIVVGPHRQEARIRGIQCGHEAADTAPPGSRTALNLVGLERADVARGDAVVRPGDWPEPEVLDTALHLLPGARLSRRLKAYVGSGEYDVTVKPLGEGYARLFLPVRLPIAPGDRVILRDPGPDVTLGGAEVLDVDPATKIKEAPTVLAFPLVERIVKGRRFVDGDTFRLLTGEDAPPEWVVDPEWAQTLGEGVAVPGVPAGVVTAVLGDGFEVAGGRIRRREQADELAADPRALAYLEALAAEPFAPPSPGDLGVPPAVVRALVNAGHAVESDGVVFAAHAFAEAAERVRQLVLERGAVTVGDVRDVLGTSRKYALPVLNELDRRGVTRRRGDERVPGPRAEIAPG